ncbi:MAG: ferrous iron transport protein B [Elusimicrobiota bacterium]|jgi:ferrous iron transport protein B|nr:ferrous iron transport protein B [Elusimicrobiota bacterium]
MKKITVALAGNPNCGKSTIFNALTGSNQHVGNYPGVTVEKKSGKKIHKDYDITIVDLPGTYSLSAYSDDEVVARDFIIKDKPDIVVHVVDASNLERNLYLFTQIREIDAPVLIALNMVDILESKGQKIDIDEIERMLGVSVISVVGNKAKGIDNLLNRIIEDYERHKSEKGVIDHKPASVDYGDDIKNEIVILESLIEKESALSNLPKSWLAVKLLDNDALAAKNIEKSENADKILKQAEKSRAHIQEHFNETPESKIAEYRYGFTNAVAKSVIKELKNKKKDWTPLIDKFALSRALGIPIFAAVMLLIFSFTFTLSTPVVKLFETFFAWFGDFASSVLPESPIQSLLVDGIIGGVGGVLSFFPLVLFMFFAIAFFEDSGYMARAAFVMDKIMSRFGLHGKSFLPMMISTNGCAVPGIMATRTLDSKRDRLITMFVAPFMICGAKLPIFALFIGAFFAQNQRTAVMFLMYVLSIIIALSAAKFLSKTVLKGEPAHFVMELPPYHIPTLKGLLLKMWERGWIYIKKAGTIIVLLTIIIWAGFKYPQTPINPDLSEEENAVVQMENSVLGRLGQVLAPIVKPIGMDGNRSIALIAGLAAKEVVVSTLGTIYSLGEVDTENDESTAPLREKIAADSGWSPLKALAFLIFCMIYPPCIAALAVFFKETGSKVKWLVLMFMGNTAFAWLAAFLIFQVGTFLKLGV